MAPFDESAILFLVCFAFVWIRNHRERRRIILRRQRLQRKRRLQVFERLQRQQLAGFTLFLASGALGNAGSSSRLVWTKPRNTSFLDEVVIKWDDEEFKKNFRLTRATFQYLCSELQPHLQKMTVVRTPISIEKRVSIALWRLGTNVEYRTISHLFGVGLSTVCVVVHEVCKAIVETLAARYIKMPEGDQLKTVVSGFATKWSFPQCVGAVDGTHIPIIAPKENPTDYFNRKGHHSIVMQAVVDHEYKFQDIYVGWPGSVHDARIFMNSQLFIKGEAGTLLPTQYKNINGVDVPLMILGDPAYPLLPWLMKPYSDNGRLSQRQSNFNYRLSCARMVVENAFGRLKGRWRCLMKRNDNDVTFMTTLVASCCVLHNICEMHNDAFNNEWIILPMPNNGSNTNTDVDFSTVSTTQCQATATRIRDALSVYVENH